MISQSLRKMAFATGCASALAFSLVLGPRAAVAQAGAPSLVIDSTAIAESGARFLAELVAARVPGASVTWLSGDPSVAPYVSLRGVSGGTGSGRPYLYLDGVLQMDDEYWISLDPERQKPAHHWRLPVDEIARVDVVLGASGGAMLELGAARGAVLVTTRRPSSGAWRSRLFAETWLVGAGPSIRSTTTTVGSLSPSGSTAYCTLAMQASGSCTPTGTRRTNPFGGAQPFQPATGVRAGVSAVGSTLGVATRVAVVADASPGALGDRTDRLDLSFAQQGNLTARISALIDIRAAGTFADQYTYSRLRQTGHVARYPDQPDPGPAYIPANEYPGRYEGWRSTVRSALSIAIRPRDSLDIGVGFDRLSREMYIGHNFLSGGDVFSEHVRNAKSVKLRFVATRGRADRIQSRVVAAAFYRHDDIRDESDFGSLAITRPAMLAQYLEYSLESRSRRGVTVGLRREASVDRDRPWLDDEPLKFASAHWVLSDEAWANGLRSLGRSTLRVSYGEASDVQAADDAFGRVSDAGGALGLSRERVIERELAWETITRGERLRVGASLFDRRVSGGHLRVPISAPTGFADVLRPGIPTIARGGELSLDVKQQLTSSTSLQMQIWTAYAATNFGELPIATGISSFFFPGSPSVIFRSGGSYGAMVGGRPTFTDVNGDGIIVGAESEFGMLEGARVNPTVTAGVVLSLRLGSRWNFGATLDAKGGHHRYDYVWYRACVARVCDAVYDPETPLADQALIAEYQVPVRPADYLRVRELTLRRNFARSGATVSLIAQNALTWTRFSGEDAEATIVVSPGVFAGEYFQQPIAPRFSLRVDLGSAHPR